ncbi:hypothetical protein ECG_08005 [Echinococcus granulosus]|uniref:Uncharacterized protein n=1 Tax=Echinococcus granulosus TaxID=6210 RepID=A0A068X371_ECHGR|nr:hypothetical protein ECG_08005 [Echinococcus granulosus]CDS24337.1 hypothetical protein EgrG_000317400 [Echinococcus granulosus]
MFESSHISGVVDLQLPPFSSGGGDGGGGGEVAFSPHCPQVVLPPHGMAYSSHLTPRHSIPLLPLCVDYNPSDRGNALHGNGKSSFTLPPSHFPIPTPHWLRPALPSPPVWPVTTASSNAQCDSWLMCGAVECDEK